LPRRSAYDDAGDVAERTYRALVGADNARILATESRTHWLAPEYRPMDVGDGWIELSALALGASRELDEDEDGAISDDADGLRIWVGEEGYDLTEQ
jgi:hypothetical protein